MKLTSKLVMKIPVRDHFFSLLDFTEKKSSKKAESAQAVKLNKTFAPIFLKGLTDLKVMDGSQVIMTVEVSGT